jgi:hypothetical protein
MAAAAAEPAADWAVGVAPALAGKTADQVTALWDAQLAAWSGHRVTDLKPHYETLEDGLLGWAPDRFRWLSVCLSGGRTWRLFVAPDPEWDGPIDTVHIDLQFSVKTPPLAWALQLAALQQPSVRCRDSADPHETVCVPALTLLKGRLITRAWTQRCRWGKDKSSGDLLHRLFLSVGNTREEDEALYQLLVEVLPRLPPPVVALVAAFVPDLDVFLLSHVAAQEFEWGFNLLESESGQ